MPQYVQLPNNALFPVAEGEDYSAAMRAAYAKYPEAFGGTPATKTAPQTGLMAELKGAGANLLNIGRTGIGALLGDSTQAAEAGVARQVELQKKYKSSLDPDKIVDKFGQGEYLGAAGEALGQVPSAVASIAPSAAQTVGLAMAGRLGGGALGAIAGPAGAVVGSQVGQYALPAIVGFIQALGGQAQEKVQTQKEAGEKPDVDALALAPYATGVAALDLLGSRIAMPSIFKKMGGQKVTEETADAAAAATRKATIDEARKVAGRGTLNTILRGTGGFVLGELPTEVLQDVIDRAAVGKNLTDDEAIKGYRNTALTMLLAAPLGGGFGVHQRIGARDTVAKEDSVIAAKNAQQAALEAQTAALEAEAARNTPEALLQLDAQYQDAVQRMQALQAAAGKKPNKDSTEDEKIAYKEGRQELSRFQTQEFNPLKVEYEKRRGAIVQLKKTQTPGYQALLPGVEPTDTDTTPADLTKTQAAEPVDYAQQVRQLKQLDEDQQTQLAQTSDPEELIKLLDRQDKTRAALAEANKAAAATPKAGVDRLASITRRLEIAKEEGDSDKIRKYAQQLIELQAQSITSRQQEIPLEKFKGTSETTDQFNRRLYEPQGYTQAEQTSPTDRPYDDYLSDQEKLDRMRQEGFTEQDIARMEKQARMGVVGGESAAVSEQGLLFGEETVGGIQSGKERAAPTASRAELRADIQIARETGNKAAAARAKKQLDELDPSEKSEDKFAGTTAQRQGDVARARQPVRVSQQQAAADARAQAYADMVAIVAKYNKGLAKAAELETARAAVVDNLITDIEATRGVAVPDAEARAIRAQANQLLYDLVSRFGDTRNLSQKSKTQFLPAQNKDGSFSASPVEGRGVPTIESRAPGRQTFAKQYAASQTIKEGLNELKNKALATDRTTIERKLSVAQDTEQALRAELDRAFARGDIPADQRKILEAIADNLKVISGNPESRSIAAAYAARINARVTPSEALTADIKDVLAQAEAAKRSESQIETRETAFGTGQKTTTAQQQELFASDKELQGFVFDTPAAFNTWLASDALQQMRSSVGLGMPTVARLLKRLAPFQKRADAFRTQADALTTRIETLGAEYKALQDRKAGSVVLLRAMTTEELTARSTQLRTAQAALQQAQATLKGIRDKMDAELSTYQQEFIQAETAFNFSVQVSEDITKTIAANTDTFQKGEIEAIKKILAAKKELNTLLTGLKSDMFPGGADKTAGKNWASVLEDFSKDKKVVIEQQKIVDATRQWRAALALNQTQSRVVAFLDKDLSFQMQLQAEANQIDELVGAMLNAKLTLDLAFKQQQRSRTKQTELKKAEQDIADARNLVAQAETDIADVIATEKDLLAEMGVATINAAGRAASPDFVQTMKAATEFEKQLVESMDAASAERSFSLAEAARLTPRMPKQTRLSATKNETQADREARNIKERSIEQEQVEALQTLPAERISFEKRRDLLDVANAVPERVLELDAVIDGADEMVINTQARNDHSNAAIAELDVKIAASAKKVFSKTKNFKSRLDQQAEKIVLDRLREERAALVENAARTEREVASITAEKSVALGKKAKLLSRAEAIEQQFSNDIPYNEAGEPLPNPVTATLKARIPVVERLIAKNNAKLKADKGTSKEARKLRESRKIAVRDYERELGVIQTKLETKRGMERLRVTKGRVETTADLDVAEGERLRSPVKGPVVRKIGVGQGKVLQAGQVRPITGLQAQRSANVFSLNVLRGRVAEENQKAQQAALDLANASQKDAASALMRSDAADNSLFLAELALQTATENSKTVPQRKREAAAEAAEDAVLAEQDYAGKSIDEINDSEDGIALRVGGVAPVNPVDPVEAQKFIDGVKANLPANVVFVYAATPGKIPVRLLNLLAEEGINPTVAVVQGAVFRDGTVLVVGDQHSSLLDLEQTVAHELIGHYGIDTLIGMERLGAYAEKTDLLKLAEEIGGAGLLQEVNDTIAAQARAGKGKEIQDLQALREIIAHTEEARVDEAFRDKAQRWIKELVGMVRSALRQMGFVKLPAMSASDVFYALRQSRKAFKNKTIGAYRDKGSVIAFRTKRNAGEFDTTPEPSILATIHGNMSGLAGRMQYIDKDAAVSAAFKTGMKAGVITDVEAGNAEFLLRMGEYVSQIAMETLTHGNTVLVTTKTATGTEHTYKSIKGPTPVDMAAALHKGGFASDSEAEGLFTLVTSGERAKQVGWDKLNYTDPAAAEAKYKRALAHLAANPKQDAAIREAMALYKTHGAGQMDLLVQTGVLTAAKAAELKAITYVPYYRVNANGEVQLMVDKERPVRIGNIKDEPELQQLVGDNKQIMPAFASIVQNTFMLTRLALRNQTVKETAFTLHKIGIASRIGMGPGPAGASTVRFKKNGVDMHVIIDTDMYGIPAKYIVEGMEGIKTTIPAVVRLLGIPADLIRKFVTRAPPYAIRQAIRDPLNAWLTTGTDAFPVLSSFKELASMVAGQNETERVLRQAGAVSSNVFTGDERDMARVLREITSGKSGWTKLLAAADTFALKGDTSTRAVIYKDSIAKGMSHQQALLRAIESMNFHRRGLSPSIQMLSTMIPFFNAQIQGIDVLYRAFKGDMTHNEQLKIREKLFNRGLLLAIGTMAYAAAMQDDEAYKRAKPEERLANWFVYLPGVSEPVRVPIPFEMGFLFKALPEAVYNLAAGDVKASEVTKGLTKLLGQSQPLALPQALKPLTEVVLGSSFFGGDIESKREEGMLAKDRYRENSTEVAKILGSVTGMVGVSPIKIDYLIRGYTGGLGLALVQLANPILNTEATDIAKPSMKPSKVPFFGGLFQPIEGRGTMDMAYDRMLEIQQVKGSYNALVEKGKNAEAQAFIRNYADKLALASTSGAVQNVMGKMAAQERFIRANPKMTTEQKDVALERLDKMRVAYARNFISLADRTTPQ